MTHSPQGTANTFRFFLLACLVILIVIIVRVVGLVVLGIKEVPEFWVHPVQYTLGITTEQWVGFRQGWHLASPIMALAGKFVCVAVGISILILGAPIGWTFLLRRSPPTVFISYHHSKAQIVDELVSMVGDDRLRFEYLPFATAPEHDQLLDAIQDAIRRCEIVLCIPGPTQ